MKRITIVAAAIMLLTSCRKDMNELHSDPIGPVGLATIAKITRPLNVNFYSSVNPASPTLTCTLPGVPFAIANSGYFLHGNATHLGLINAETSMGQDGFCNLNGNTFILSTTTAGQIVAANGDMITYTGNDEIDLNQIIFNGGTTAAITGVWTITGGSGRFTDATGSFSIDGLVNVATPGGPTFSITGVGTITY